MRAFVHNWGDVTLISFPSYERVEELMASGMTQEEAVAAIQQEDCPGSTAIKPTRLPWQHMWARPAWKLNADNSGMDVDMVKCKALAHDLRRARRDVLLAPHDKLATSPIAAIRNKANADKQAILDADAPIQVAIDAASTPEQMEQVLINYQAV